MSYGTSDVTAEVVADRKLAKRVHSCTQLSSNEEIIGSLLTLYGTHYFIARCQIRPRCIGSVTLTALFTNWCA